MEALPRLVCPAILRAPLDSRFVEETEPRLDCPVTDRLPAKAAVPVEEILSVPLVRKEVVALRISAESVPVITAEFREARPVVLIVAAWRLPEPVAFTKVNPCREELAVTVSVPVTVVVARETRPPDWFRAPPTVR